jgi:hypothetical protein
MAFGFRPIDCASHSVPFDPIRFHSSALFRSAPLCCAVLRLPITTVAGSINPCSYTQGARPEVFALRAAPLTVGANNTISAYSTASAYWRCCQALVKSALISQRMDALSLGQLTICRLGFSDLVHRLDPGVHKLFDYPFDSIPFGSIPSASRPSVALPVHRNESVRSSSKAKQSKAKQSKAADHLSTPLRRRFIPQAD